MANDLSSTMAGIQKDITVPVCPKCNVSALEIQFGNGSFLIVPTNQAAVNSLKANRCESCDIPFVMKPAVVKVAWDITP